MHTADWVIKRERNQGFGKKHILIRSSRPPANEMHAQANVTYLTIAQTDIVKLTDRGSECGVLSPTYVTLSAFYLSASRTNRTTTEQQQNNNRTTDAIGSVPHLPIRRVCLIRLREYCCFLTVQIGPFFIPVSRPCRAVLVHCAQGSQVHVLATCLGIA
jgi:hypothetical protein